MNATKDMALFGWPGQEFYTLHITALVSLVISVVASGSVLVVMNPAASRFWKRTIGERLVVYLAVCDLLFSLSHILDHSYIVHAKAHPPDAICTAFGLFVATFVLTQAFVVCFTAVNGFVLVVRELKVSLGRYDWRLLVTTMLIPLSITVPSAIMGWIGPSGAWLFCLFHGVYGKDVRTEGAS